MAEVKIEPSWKIELKDEFNKPYFDNLVGRVKEAYAIGPVYPPGSKIFSAFDLTPFQDVKVVIVGQDPYHGPGQANGLAFSVNPGVPMPPSLVNIFREVQAETGAPMPPDGNLERWARQGVLLLNSSLTVPEHRPRAHAVIGWSEFTDAAIRRLEKEKENLVFMLWGSDAIRKGSFIDRGRHLVLTSAHPSPLSAYRGFFGNGHFNAANRYLQEHGKTPIVW